MENISQNPNEAPQGEKSSVGPLIGSIIVIIILILGAIYFWGDRLNNEVPEVAPAALSASDEVTNIEADLNNTTEPEINLEGL